MTTSKVFQAIVPSNIALLKYWGKADEAQQWPANDSLSITLKDLNSATQAEIVDEQDHIVSLDGIVVNRDAKLGDKIFKHLDFLADRFDRKAKLRITSRNSFPTGCGIASSASGIGALTLASLAAWFETDSIDKFATLDLDREKLAHLARLGSGSAGRSFFSGFVQWEKGKSHQEQRIYSVHDAGYWSLRDTIVLFSKSEKKVGSTQAHRAAWSSPLFAPRLAGLNSRLGQMKAAIADRNMEILGPLIEAETLEMHGVIMSAEPAVFYFDKPTGDFLAWLRYQREEQKVPVYFTLDAGPNVHLIYESRFEEQVKQLLQTYPTQLETISDSVGDGPTLTRLEG